VPIPLIEAVVRARIVLKVLCSLVIRTDAFGLACQLAARDLCSRSAANAGALPGVLEWSLDVAQTQFDFANRFTVGGRLRQAPTKTEKCKMQSEAVQTRCGTR
jgi:hypothetical protein